jgi:plastocyanin
MNRSFFLAMILGCGLGCSNSSPNDDGGTDAAPSDANGGMDMGTQDAGPVNGCTTFTAGTTVTGPSTDTPAQYMPNCIQIAAGGTVTFNSNFTAHPLQASGGATPTPIQTTSSGTTVMFTFPNPGVYGFHCEAHPAIMFGAVEVTQ